jgi:hypothetical protein
MTRGLLSDAMTLKSKLSRLLVVGNFAAFAALDHPAFALDQLQLAEPQEILHMILALGRALPCKFGVFGLEGGQAELLEMMLQQHLRCVGHAAAPGIRLM